MSRRRKAIQSPEPPALKESNAPLQDDTPDDTAPSPEIQVSQDAEGSEEDATQEDKEGAVQSSAVDSEESQELLIVLASEIPQPHGERPRPGLTSDAFPLEGYTPPPPDVRRRLEVGRTPVESPKRKKYYGKQMGDQDYRIYHLRNDTEHDMEVCLEDGSVYVAQFRREADSTRPVARVPAIVAQHVAKLASCAKNFSIQN